jgi:hypothetical protein
MVKTLLSDLREWMTDLAGVAAFTVVALLLIMPLMWLEHHHHEVFWTIVIMAEWMSIAYFWRLANGPGVQTCPHCEKRFSGADMS